MLQKIVFLDNLFYITRSLDVLYNCLQLDISDELFAEKIISDIVFFDTALEALFNRIEPQPHLPDYAEIMHSLYFCTVKYINLLQFIKKGRNEDKFFFKNTFNRIDGIEKKHRSLIDKINIDILEKEITNDSYNMVSQTELSELLNF